MTTFHDLHHALSVQRFLNQIVDDLVSYQKSTIVLLPAGIDSVDVWELIRSELDRRQPDLREMSRSDLDGHPVVALESFFGTAQPALARSRTLEAFFERAYTDQLLPDILYLEDLQHLPETVIVEWLALITRWAKLNQGLTQTDRRRTALCIVVPAERILGQLPEVNVHLAIHWWWGFPSVSETLMLCRYDTLVRDNHCLTSWREHLLASLATGDAAFLAYIQPYVDQCANAFEQRVLGFATNRGWTVPILRSCGAENICKVSPHSADIHPQRPRRLSVNCGRSVRWDGR
jgi:hypothetical protein